MKKRKTKLILPSLLTILGCIAIGTGSTYSLFTSSSENNITISSGKVDVGAYIDTSSYKYKQLDSDGFDASNKMYGGTFNVDNTNGTVSLTNIVPGDGVSFDIKIKNNSNIKTYYRSIVSYDLTKSDASLINALTFKMDYDLDGSLNEGLPNYETYKSEYKELAIGNEEKTLNVSISLENKEGVDQSYLMDKSISLSFKIEAIQANGVDLSNNQEVKEGTELRVVTPTLNANNEYIIPRNVELGDKANGLRKDNVYYLITPGTYDKDLNSQDYGNNVTIDGSGSTFSYVHISNEYNKGDNLFTIKNFEATRMFIGQIINGKTLLTNLKVNQLTVNNSYGQSESLTISNSTFYGTNMNYTNTVKTSNFANGCSLFINGNGGTTYSNQGGYKEYKILNNTFVDAYKNAIQITGGTLSASIDISNNTISSWGYENNTSKERAAIKVYYCSKYQVSKVSEVVTYNEDAKTLINNTIDNNTITSLDTIKSVKGWTAHIFELDSEKDSSGNALTNGTKVQVDNKIS